MKILINGVKASAEDLTALHKNLAKRKDRIKRVRLSQAKLEIDTV